MNLDPDCIDQIPSVERAFEIFFESMTTGERLKVDQFAEKVLKAFFISGMIVGVVIIKSMRDLGADAEDVDAIIVRWAQQEKEYLAKKPMGRPKGVTLYGVDRN